MTILALWVTDLTPVSSPTLYQKQATLQLCFHKFLTKMVQSPVMVFVPPFWRQGQVQPVLASNLLSSPG